MFDGLWWENGWPEDGLVCNAGQSECLMSMTSCVLMLYHFSLNRGPGVTFQHESAISHTALITRQSLAQNNDVLPRPAVSPDLNPVKHVWDELGRRARECHQSNTLQDLQTALTHEWQPLPNALIQQYVDDVCDDELWQL